MAERNTPLTNEELAAALTKVFGGSFTKGVYACEYEVTKGVFVVSDDGREHVPYPESEKLVEELLNAVGEWHPEIYVFKLCSDHDGLARMYRTSYVLGCD